MWVARASSGSRYSSAQQSNGVNSHLCGSRMNESACSMPSYFGSQRPGEDAGSAVGAVDVEPPAALLGERADAGEVVDDAGVGRARRADHRGDVGQVVRHRRSPRTVAAVSRWSGVSTDQRVHLQQAQRVHDRGVRVGADDHPQTDRPARPGPLLRGLAGNGERRQVAGRSTGDEAAAGCGRAARPRRRSAAARCSPRRSRRTPPARRCPGSRRRTPACRTAGWPWSARPG